MTPLTACTALATPLIGTATHLVGALTQTGTTGTPVAQPDLVSARQQMALSLGWHIVLSCLGIGFASMVVATEFIARRRQDRVMLTLARRWSKALGVLFPVGAVSGTVLSFEFGILWPGLMGTFGDVFGIPFAMEGFAFFIEAIFIGIYAYGWGRLSPRVHMLCGLPIIVSGILAAAFIMMANAWMNNPTGFTVAPNGTVTVTDSWAAVLNAGMPVQFTHMLLAAFIVAGFLTAMVYAWPLLKGSKLRYHRLGFVIPFTMAAVAVPAQLFVGDLSVRWIAANQPTKEAAAEAHYPTEGNAPEILFGVYHPDGSVTWGLSIPDGLSILTGGNPDTVVPGLDQTPPADRPPVNIVHWAFDIMVLTGSFLLLPSAWFAWTWRRTGRPPRPRPFWWAAVAAGPLSVLCLWAGWTVTEVGRQPWVVYEVLRTADAVSAAPGLRWGYYTLIVVYTALTAATIYGLRRLAAVPLPPHALVEVDPTDRTAGERRAARRARKAEPVADQGSPT